MVFLVFDLEVLDQNWQGAATFGVLGGIIKHFQMLQSSEGMLYSKKRYGI